METNLLITLIIISIISIILFGSIFYYIINNQKNQEKQLRIPRFGQTKEQADKYYDRYPERFLKKWRK